MYVIIFICWLLQTYPGPWTADNNFVCSVFGLSQEIAKRYLVFCSSEIFQLKYSYCVMFE